ncbi:MAG: protein O-mannosyl-transferase family [Candidatus Muiribacteriota bacterium]
MIKFLKINKNHLMLAVLWLLFLIYFLNLAPGLNTRDSGEFLVSAKYLDITHPPGYPLYSSAGRLFYAFGGERAIIFMSSFFGVLSFFILYLMCSKSITLAVFGLILFLSESYFYYSTTAEVYTLNLFFYVLVFYFSLKQKYYAALFAISIASLIQPVNFILLIPFTVGAFFKVKRKWKAFFILALGAVLFLYLPFRASAELPLNYGNPSNIKNFLVQISGLDFGVRENVFNFDLERVANNFFNFFKKASIRIETIFFIPGLFILWKKNKYFFYKSTLFLILYVVFFLLLNLNIDHAWHFFMPAMFLAYYICILSFKKLKLNFKILIPLLLIFYIFPNSTPNHTNAAYNYVKNAAISAQEPAIIFTARDNRTFYFLYYKYFKENKEEDFININILNLGEDWYLKNLSQKLKLPDTLGDNPEFNLRQIVGFLSSEYNLYLDVNPEMFGFTGNYYRQGVLYQLFKKSRNDLIIARNLRIEGLPFKLDKKDPELYNLGISFSDTFDYYKKYFNEEKKRFYSEWKNYYTSVYY